MAEDMARADGPSGRVYGELWDSKARPASAARHSQVMKWQTVRPVVSQERLHRLAEVVHEMKTIDHLHRVGRPPANTIGVQDTAIATHRRYGRMPGQPGR
jgi:hypothetical protein